MSIIFAIDIEARGQGPKSHGIISIGVCVGNGKKEEVLEKVRFDLEPLPFQGFEERCWERFWSSRSDLLETLTKDAQSAKPQILAFRMFLDKWHKKTEDSLYILSDNPGFDFGMINYYLDYFGCATLNYDHKGVYLNNHDADSYGRGVKKQKFDDQWFSNATACKDLGIDLDPNTHDHMPENDAEFIYRLHWNMVQ